MKPRIKKSQITKVYSGSPGCCCGCRGTYSETIQGKGIILAKYESAPESEVEVVDGLDGVKIVYWDRADGKRTYTIYYREGA